MPRIWAVTVADWPRWCKTSIVTICSLVSLAKVRSPSVALGYPGPAWSASAYLSTLVQCDGRTEPSQARNDSGSLTPSLTGLVTAGATGVALESDGRGCRIAVAVGDPGYPAGWDSGPIAVAMSWPLT